MVVVVGGTVVAVVVVGGRGMVVGGRGIVVVGEMVVVGIGLSGTVVGGVVVVSTTIGILTSSVLSPLAHPADRSAPARNTAENRLTCVFYACSGTRKGHPREQLSPRPLEAPSESHRGRLLGSRTSS